MYVCVFQIFFYIQLLTKKMLAGCKDQVKYNLEISIIAIRTAREGSEEDRRGEAM